MANEILVATRKGLFSLERTTGTESGWRIASVDFLGDNVSIALTDRRDGSRYAALDHGHFGVKLHRSLQGEAWQECAAPAYPAKPDGEIDRDQWGKEIPWSTVRIWAMEPGGSDQPGRLWCGTVPGGLFRSDDSGTSWELVRTLWDDPRRQEWFGGGLDLPGLHSICVDPRDPNCLRLGVSCGGVWQSDDGGESWNCRADGMRADYMPPEAQNNPNIQDPHCLVQCHAAPDALWVQHHNGIFRSTDGSKSWSEVTDVKPSNFGFAVAVHPEKPDTAWFVPGVKDELRIPVAGKLVVTRTRDGGKTFEVLASGLPQEHAYDIVFRHALDVDNRGDCVAFGTTTGGFWVSENQGDDWQCISNNLPPVYSVRFA